MTYKVKYAIIGSINIKSENEKTAAEKLFDIHGKDLCKHVEDIVVMSVEESEEDLCTLSINPD